MKKFYLTIFAIYFTICLSMANANHNDEMESDVESVFMDSFKGQPAKEIFKAYHFIHEKEYELNSEEGLRRYRNFKNSLKWIEEENKKKGEEVYGITQFADMSLEEYIEKHTMKPEHIEAEFESLKVKPERFLSEETHHHHHHHEHHHHHHHDHDHDHHDEAPHGNHGQKDQVTPNPQENNDLQGSYPDWRKFDGPVKNQGSCGSCWSFSAMGAIENLYNQLKGKYTNFAEQYLVDCNSSNGGCNGGWMPKAYDFIIKNGILSTEHYPYKAKAQECDAKWKPYEYKILKGYKRFYEGYPYYSDARTWDDLLKQGPLAVCVDAATNEYRHYRPRDKFSILESNSCKKCTHAVTAVAMVNENGKDYIISRNSWGTRWGYKGYHKIPKSNPCHQIKYGFLPTVYDGKVPDKNPPKPKPKPSDCVKVYGGSGFHAEAKGEVCDGTSGFRFGGRATAILGVKFPEKRVTNKTLSLRLFRYTRCWGQGRNYDEYVPIEQSTEYPEFNGKQQWSSSLAFHKYASENCISFHEKPCLEGEAKFSICNDIVDSDGVNLDGLKNIRSYVIDHLNIESITLYDKPNFEGTSYTLDAMKTRYNLPWNTRRFLAEKVRSIKINPRNNHHH